MTHSVTEYLALRKEMTPERRSVIGPDCLKTLSRQTDRQRHASFHVTSRSKVITMGSNVVSGNGQSTA